MVCGWLANVLKVIKNAILKEGGVGWVSLRLISYFSIDKTLMTAYAATRDTVRPISLLKIILSLNSGRRNALLRRWQNCKNKKMHFFFNFWQFAGA